MRHVILIFKRSVYACLEINYKPLSRFKVTLSEILDGLFPFEILREALLRAIHDIDAAFSKVSFVDLSVFFLLKMTIYELVILLFSFCYYFISEGCIYEQCQIRHHSCSHTCGR